MTITVNGIELNLDTDGASLGDVLANADDLVEKTGAVILGLRLDGTTVEADDLPGLQDRPASEFRRLEIESVPASELRGRAYGSLLEFLGALREWSAGTGPSEPLREAWDAYGRAYSGLLSADEHSFLDLLDRDLASADSGADYRRRLVRHADNLEPIFRERLEEIRDPVAAMRSASRLYEAERQNLADVSVRLQTGKDAEAMRSILLFVEIFHKANRILPELVRSGADTANLRIDGKPVPEFYESFNDVLRQLMQAFEAKDAVMIGDLAEYEIVPRMNAFFEAMTGALDT